MTVRFGVHIEPQFGFDYESVKNLALHAEKMGFYSFWASDHFFLDDKSEEKNCLEAWTLITAIAAITKKLRMGILVTGNNYRYPAILAKIAATVDMISDGRLEFGIGSGWKEIEYNAYGIPFPSVKDRMDMLEESIQIIKKLWSEPKADFDGKHYKIKDAFSAPKPIQKLPPIFIGGTGKKRILNMVAKYADYCNFGWFTSPDQIPPLLTALKGHCEKVSRDYENVGKSYFASVFTAETEEELNDLLETQAKERNITLEEYKKRLIPGIFVGTPEKVQQRFRELIDLGFDYFQVMFPYKKEIEVSETFAKQIIPQ
ncbi:MAG: TIGR03560 family F420-dependent LLM class oxidoreductase, partial [Promethearchaeota archaeon]